MKKKFSRIIMCVISLFLLYNVWQMILKYDVQNIRNDYFDVINDNKSDLYYGALLQFSYPEIESQTAENFELEIEFAYHNFTHGYIDTRFSYDIYDRKKFYTGAYRVHARMYIEKRNERWVVTKIEEEAGTGFFTYTEDMYYNGDGTVQERWK